MAALGIGYRPRTRYRGLIATLLLVILGCLVWWWLVGHVPARSRSGQSPATAAERGSGTPIVAPFTAVNGAPDDGGAHALLAPASAPLGRTLDRAYAALAAAARPCAAQAAAEADPAQRTRHHVRVDHGRVTNLQRVDGDMNSELVECIEQRWRAARWKDDDQPRTVTMEIVETLDQLRHGR